MIVLGCDPGQKGATCVFDLKQGPIDIVDLPLCQDGRKTMQLDVKAFSKFVFDLKPRRVVIERQGPMPSDGVVPAFRLGLIYGQIRSALDVMGIPTSLVSPVTWKKYHELPAEKENGRTKAIQQFPHLEPLLRRKLDHNRADSVFIAAWGAAHIRGLEAGTV